MGVAAQAATLRRNDVSSRPKVRPPARGPRPSTAITRATAAGPPAPARRGTDDRAQHLEAERGQDVIGDARPSEATPPAASSMATRTGAPAGSPREARTS